jgi:hypothetical protein
MREYWTEDQINILLRNKYSPRKYLANLLGKSSYSISSKKAELKKKSYDSSRIYRKVTTAEGYIISSYFKAGNLFVEFKKGGKRLTSIIDYI